MKARKKMQRTLLDALLRLLDVTDTTLAEWYGIDSFEPESYTSLALAAETVRSWLSEQTVQSSPHMQAYVNRGGVHCPYCHSDRLTGASLQLDGGRVWQKVSCGNCDREWEDRYDLSAVREIAASSSVG